MKKCWKYWDNLRLTAKSSMQALTESFGEKF